MPATAWPLFFLFPLTRSSRHLQLLLKYIKINDQNHGRHDENVVRHEAATTPEQIQCTCAVQTVGSLEGVSRRNTLCGRPSTGVFPRVFVSVTGLRYNRQSMQIRIIFYRKNCVVTAIVPQLATCSLKIMTFSWCNYSFRWWSWMTLLNEFASVFLPSCVTSYTCERVPPFRIYRHFPCIFAPHNLHTSVCLYLFCKDTLA